MLWVCTQQLKLGCILYSLDFKIGDCVDDSIAARDMAAASLINRRYQAFTRRLL